MEVPTNLMKRCEELREQMVEKVAEQDDDLMNSFFEN
jgi:translation elongation factor EF-G